MNELTSATDYVCKGDCLELMKEIPDKSIDMILCDMPYGTSACKWDSVLPMDKVWEAYKRIIKDDGAIVLFGGEPFSSTLRLSNLEMYKYDWKWEKPNGANFLNTKFQPSKVHEDIMVFSKSASSYSKRGNMRYFPQMDEGKPYLSGNGNNREVREYSNVRSPIRNVVTVNKGTRFPRSVIRFKHDSQKLHPTQKPVALLEYLIKTYSSEGDTVLDNCMGVGSTCLACINTGRHFIGYEIDDNFYAIAKQRIDTALKIKNGGE